MTSPEGTAATTAAEMPASAPRQGRYLDALLTEMDRWMMPDLVTDRAQLLYSAMRRVMVTLVTRTDRLPLPDEVGIAPVDAPTGDDEDALQEEGRRIDALIAAQDVRLARIDVPRPSRSLSVDAVQAALRAAGEPSATISSMRVVVGGRSKETVLLDLDEVANWPRHLVMRRDLQVGSLGTTVVDEFAVLELLHARGVKVPRPYHLSRDGGGLDTPFILLEAMRGEATGQLLAAPDSREKVLAAARALASIHAVPSEAVAPLLSRSEVSPGAITAEIDEFAAIWTREGRAKSSTLDAALAWLKANAATIEGRGCFVHADYSFHNILFDGDEVSALLDWELARIGHAAEDLGYIKFAAQGVVEWSEFMAAYAAAGGRTVNAREIHFYAMFGKVWLLTKVLKSRELFESGQMDDILKADSVSFWLPRIVQALSWELREIAACERSRVSE